MFPKNIDLTTNTQMLGSNRFSNHHLRTPNAKEIQEFPQESISTIQIQEPKTPFTNEKLSPLNKNERTKIITTFQMGG